MKILVLPYDLTDMPPGTQAPIRRLWYGEAVIDPYVQPHPDSPSSLPQQQQNQDDDKEKDKDLDQPPLKEVIRYAVHLKFVCPPARMSARPRAHSAGQTSAYRGGFSKFGMTSMSSNLEPDTVESDEGEASSHSANEGLLGLGTARRKFTRSSSMTDPRKIYLAGEIRLVFASRIPDEEEMVRAENEEGYDKYYDWEPAVAGDSQ